MLHAPVIEGAASYQQVRPGEEVEITCWVHASPPPAIEWYRNGRLLAAADTVTSTRGHAHTLIVPAIGGRETFGRYGCRAVNSLGEAMRLTEVGGLADPVIFTTPAGPPPGTDEPPLLTWTVRSLSPVIEFRLDYAPAVGVGEKAAAWRSVTVGLTADTALTTDLYMGRLMLADLQDAGGGSYSVRVASHNVYGWSEPLHRKEWLTLPIRPPRGSTSPKPLQVKPSPRSTVTATPLDSTTRVSSSLRSSTASPVSPSSLSSSPLSASSSSSGSAMSVLSLLLAVLCVMLPRCL